MNWNDSPLGKTTTYIQTYAPQLLFPISRKLGRDRAAVTEPLQFHGWDLWTGYEVSWLNSKGKPEVSLADFIFPCTSPQVIESKSFKLYLNSLNQTTFDSWQLVKTCLEKDLSDVAKGSIKVNLYPLNKQTQPIAKHFNGICLDELDIEINCYEVNPVLLTTSLENVEEEFYSDLLKSNCLATGQPDWGSVYIHYKGPKIHQEGLLKYIISYRNHSGFAEHCAEQMYQDILNRCQPEKLTVYLRYTRRGGLDINAFRSNFESLPENVRLIRQ